MSGTPDQCEGALPISDDWTEITNLSRLEGAIDRAMPGQRHRFRRQLRAIAKAHRQGKPVDGRLVELGQAIERSEALRESRRLAVPAVTYDQRLPIHTHREEIAQALQGHQVVVVSGETGSGKSTQLPKMCLEMGRGVDGMIGHTQPRRIAARSIAARLAEELSLPLGREVGFKIRFTDTTSPQTFVKLMTDGILLAETQGDRFLRQYDTIILDEAHERSLNVDFLIGYLKRLLPKRPDLKLIVTSATIDSVRFSRHFQSSRGPAPVIEVSGRNYPVQVRYRPLEPDEDSDEPDLEQAVLDAVDELCGAAGGDILVFMPTQRHIHDMAKALRGRVLAANTEILPLYARLPANQQQRVFQPHTQRRIVIATNVAESSLTVPGIRYVIDSGTARISRYSARSRTQRLPIEAISRASADQRAGRCGRLGPGICIRLFGEDDYLDRERFATPEILRSNLASVILQTKALKLGEVEGFPFLDVPKPATIRDGYRTLFELGAIDGKRGLTERGHQLSRLPVDPRIGRMILEGHQNNCLAEVLVIASALEIGDPRERPLDKQQEADAAHTRFADAGSDFLAFLVLWDFFHGLREKLSRSQLRKACRQNFLSYNRMREWLDVHRQLLQLVEEAGLKRQRRQDDYAAVHCAVLSGLLSSVAFRTGTYEYTVAGGGTAHLWPGSGLFEHRPTWVMATELVETTKRYLRTCAKIDPAWIEPLAAHLVKRSYSEPHWDRKSGSTLACEKVSLFGLAVVPRRQVQFGPINPEHARQLFIQHALVEGQLDTSADFFTHNRQLLEEMERLQAKLRRHDLLLGEWSRYEFYDRRVPSDVCDARRLLRWLREVRGEAPRVLHMQESDLLDQPTERSAAEDFPDTITDGRNRLPVEYRFEPGSEHDGLTLKVPVEAIGQFDSQRPGWLVPGLLQRKVTALIKSLPKPLRRKLVPAADTAARVLGEIRFGEGDVRTEVGRVLSRVAGEPIGPEDFDEAKLPNDLQMNIQVVDAEGKPLASGRDLKRVRRELAAEVSAGFDELDDPRWCREGLADWDFDELPEAIHLGRGGLNIKAYPALVDCDESVGMRLFESVERAERETHCALRRLFFLVAEPELSSHVEWMPDVQQMLLHVAPIPGFDLRRQLAELIAGRAVASSEPLPRNRADFERMIAAARQQIVPAVQDVVALVGPVFEGCHGALLAAEEVSTSKFRHAAEDVRRQLDALLGPRFLTSTPWTWLDQFPRYLRAIPLRLDKLGGGRLERDRRSTEEIAARWEAYLDRAREHEEMQVCDPELVRYRWMLEEYRVSLFAQELGTAVPVSAKRLDRQWAQVKT